MAKKRSKKSASKSRSGGLFFRAIGGLWRLISKALGSSIRFVFRSAGELDAEHQRDGFAFLLVIFSLISAAGTWFHLNNLIGRNIYASVFGAAGRLGWLIPLVFFYFAFRLFKSPDEGKSTARITVGIALLILSLAGLIHIFNGSIGTGQSAIRHGGGWIGYAVATPLVALLTTILTIPILLIILFFAILVITATPVSTVFAKLKVKLASNTASSPNKSPLNKIESKNGSKNKINSKLRRFTMLYHDENLKRLSKLVAFC